MEAQVAHTDCTNEMAELSCRESVKERRARKPSAKASSPLRVVLPHGRPRRDDPNKLYDIEIVESEEARVKVHYVGYSSAYDEWKLKSEVQYQYSQPEDKDGEFSFFTELAGQIKSRLVPSRKEDPAVRIQIPFDKQLFEQTLAVEGKEIQSAKGKVYGIDSHASLDRFLGKNWHLRVNNVYGDFTYVMLETVRFHLYHLKPLLEFDVKREDGNLHFTPVYLEQGFHLVFTFVRVDGNSKKLEEVLFD